MLKNVTKEGFGKELFNLFNEKIFSPFRRNVPRLISYTIKGGFRKNVV